MVSDAELFVMLNRSKNNRVRMRLVKLTVFSARTSNTQMLSSRLAFIGSTYAVVLPALVISPEAEGMVTVRA